MLIDKLDEVGLITAGLIPSWSSLPSWLIESLRQTIDGDWERLLDQCTRTHQIVILRNLIDRLGVRDSLPQAFRSIIEKQGEISEIMQTVCATYAVDIHYVFSELGIPHAFLKSLITGPEYYNLYERTGKDIDVLMPREGIKTASLVLRELGFRHGYFDRSINSVVYVDYEEPSDQHYEIRPLWIDVPVEADFDIKPYIADNRPRRFYLKDGGVFVRLAVELHYRLGTVCDLQWNTRIVDSQDLPSQLPGLDLETEIIYHCIKGYSDVCVLNQPRSLKLLADAVRGLQKYRKIIDVESLVNRMNRVEIRAPFWYLAKFMESIVGWEWEDSIWRTLDVPDRLDFGDFFPRVFDRRFSVASVVGGSLKMHGR